MKVLVYSAKNFEIPYLTKANDGRHQLKFVEESLSSENAMKAVGFDAISIFSADDASLLVLEKLKDFGVKFIALRSTGYDNVNLRSAERLGIKVANVPEYSPNAIAEHAVTLLLALNRKITISDRRVAKYNFNIDGLIGVDLVDKTVGIIGTGRIGSVMARIMSGFGCHLLGYDIVEDESLSSQYGLRYVNLRTLCNRSDIISIHTPLNTDTHHLIDKDMLAQMKKEVLIINTARGAIIQSTEILQALENERIGGLAMDVYEKEHKIFFRDHSDEGIDDTILKRLIEKPNVLITSHHAFLTEEALTNIAETTFENLDLW
ncbi:2-hydroxyacid dehydrogenase [Sungkyunkwania multivorans]|uniref:2-hydroxyacid dehydrogenase n=1 Tax=Sungkyunkwania multivorans TaxID=1173618 RepID=A0ABW3D127_9FLAO